MAIDKLNKIKQTSPDEVTRKDLYGGVAPAHLAHVNAVNDKLSEVIDEVNTLSLEGYKGVIDCSTNPNYPAGEKDWYWRVSVAGKIGGASGIDVEVGDQIICLETSVGGTEAAVGDEFMIIERNIQVGPNPTPVARTNNPIVAANPINTNIDVLDAAIGADNTVVTRTNNPTVANTTLNAKVQALDNAIGGNLTPVARTNNPTVSDTTVVAKISVLDNAIGVTPTTTNYIVAANSVNANITELDTQAQAQETEVGGGTFAQLVTAPGAGTLTIRSRVIGTTGNTFGFQLVDTAGVAGTVTWNAGTKNLTVEIDDGVTTDDEVEYYVNNDYFANKLFEVTSGSTGAVAVQGAPNALAGGTDTSVFTTDEASLLDAAAFAAAERPATVYNAVQMTADAVNILNQRDVHEMVPEHIIKHTLMAVIEYDFTTNPVAIVAGGTTTVEMLGGIDILPANAIIKKTYYEIETDIESTLTTATVAVQTDAALALVAAITADGTNDGIADGEQDGTAANMDKIAAAAGINIVCTETGGVYADTIDAGNIKVFIEYVIGIA